MLIRITGPDAPTPRDIEKVFGGDFEVTEYIEGGKPLREVDERIGGWLSAALSDERTCDVFKRDINDWLNSFEYPVTYKPEEYEKAIEVIIDEAYRRFSNISGLRITIDEDKCRWVSFDTNEEDVKIIAEQELELVGYCIETLGDIMRTIHINLW